MGNGMADIKLPPLPHHPNHFLHWSDREIAAIRARDLEIAKVVLEAAVEACRWPRWHSDWDAWDVQQAISKLEFKHD